jgi:hypothetical protein
MFVFASAVSVFIQNSPFDQAEFQVKTETVALPSPTDRSLQITKAAPWILKKIYQAEVYYQKAGVTLSELVPKGEQQIDLLGFSSADNRSGRLADWNELPMVSWSGSPYPRGFPRFLNLRFFPQFEFFPQFTQSR